MKVLIAEDDDVARKLLEAIVRGMGHELVACSAGDQAWRVLHESDPPKVAVLDVQMPGLSGIQISRLLAERGDENPVHVILATGRTSREDVIAGLASGAADYIKKPFDRLELEARIRIAVQTVALRVELARRLAELGAATAEIKVLQGLLPICSYCKKIRDEGDAWRPMETYIAGHSEAHFTHSICPDCRQNVVKPVIETFRRSREAS
jgi:phosphoserine phosphatase RsbU/P